MRPHPAAHPQKPFTKRYLPRETGFDIAVLFNYMDEFNEQWLALFMKSLVLEETDHVEVDIESA